MSARRLITWADIGSAVTVEHPDRLRWATLRPVAEVEVEVGLTGDAVSPLLWR
jgi:hypothetical protein